MDWDALLLSRIQFAFTIGFHIIFPSFTIGLASYLAVLEGLWLATKRDVFKNLYLFWVKIFAISFGMGVVFGVVMSYQFGTNWSVFATKVGSVLGPLLGFEVLTAFFLEASFLGIMLFGWRRVGPTLHFLSTLCVAVGTLISAFWILAANSWMQTPAGYATDANGNFYALKWLDVIFNPSFPSRLGHMVLAAYLTTAMVVAAAAALGMLRNTARAENRVALRMAILMMAIVTPVQILFGHESGMVALEHQPAKVAAMEGWWEAGPNKPTILFAAPNEAQERNDLELAVPGVGSAVFGMGPEAILPGLKQVAPDDRPPVGVVFWSFRIMVGLGLIMLALGVIGAALWLLKRLDDAKLYHRALVLAGPSGFIAVLAGWIAAEVGRQPYVVYGALRTGDAVSPVTGDQVAASLLVFMIAYAIVFSAGALYILRLMAIGPAVEEPPQPTGEGPGNALAAGMTAAARNAE